MEENRTKLSEDQLTALHKKEFKDLQNKILSMKKSIPKGDKKKKKDITDEIAKIQVELNEKHLQELKALKISIPEPPASEVETDKSNEVENQTESTQESGPKVTRAQKRRNKKAASDIEREKRIAEQAKENLLGPRILEMKSINTILKTMDLKIYNVPADGNCLYCAIIHQLNVNNMPTIGINELRRKTAEYMLDNRNDFLPFMYCDKDEEGCEQEFLRYCDEVANTKLWGGQLELKAISHILKCSIKVIQASGPPTILGEEMGGPQLILTYHRHLYQLGEHYNSTVKYTGEEDEENVENGEELQ